MSEERMARDSKFTTEGLTFRVCPILVIPEGNTYTAFEVFRMFDAKARPIKDQEDLAVLDRYFQRRGVLRGRKGGWIITNLFLDGAYVCYVCQKGKWVREMIRAFDPIGSGNYIICRP